MKIDRHAILAVAGVRVADHQNGDSLHGETPNHANCIQVGEKRHIAPASKYRQDLEADNDINDAV